MSRLAKTQSLVAAAIRAGDDGAFRTFVRDMAPPLFRQAMSLLGDPGAAQDVVQATLIGIWEGRERLPETTGRLRGYCFGILVNQAKMRLRADRIRRGHEALAATHAADTGTNGSASQSPLDTLIAHEAWELAMALPEPLRDVVALRYGLGLSLRETATELDLPEGTVSTRQRSGLEQLREQLDVRSAAIGAAPLAGLALNQLESVLAAGDVSQSIAAGAVSASRVVEATVMASATSGKTTAALAVVVLLLLAMVGYVAWAVFGSAPMPGNQDRAALANAAGGDGRTNPAGAARDGESTNASAGPNETNESSNRADNAADGDDSGHAGDGTNTGETGTGTGDASATPPVVDPQPAPEVVEKDGTTGIKGIVLDSAGDPIEGATVTASTRRGPMQMFGEAADFVVEEEVGPGGMGMRMGGDNDGPPDRSATTGADGRFTITKVEPGPSYTLRVKPASDEFLAKSRPAPAVREGVMVDAGTIRLDRPGTITGFVRDANGNPVEGAVVRIGEPMPEGMQVMRMGGSDGERRMGIVMRSETVVGGNDDGNGQPAMPRMPLGAGATYSAADGSFTLEKVAPGPKMVSARKSGHRDAVKDPVEVGENRTTTVDLSLGSPLSLVVTVRDAEGFPIEGAKVRISSGPMAGMGMMMLTGPGMEEHEPPGTSSATTGADGRAVIRDIESRDVTLQVSADGLASHQEDVRLEEFGETSREVTLRVGGSITGVVLGPDGAPLQDAFLFCNELGENRGPGGMRIGGPGAGGMHRTGSDGSFTITGLKPGPYQLNVSHNDHADGEFGPFAVVDGEEFNAGSLRLEAAGTLQVTVTDGDGKPVEGAQVEPGMMNGTFTMRAQVDDDGNEDFDIGGQRPGRTNADGVARIEGVEPGETSVRVRKSGFADGFATVTVNSGGVTSVTVTLTNGGTVLGMATRMDGSPWAGANVYLLRDGEQAGRPAAQTRTDAHGKFAFERVAAGSYRATNRLTDDGESFTVRDGDYVEVEVKETPKTDLTLTVLNSDGSPATTRPVILGWVSPGANGSLSVDWPIEDGYTDENGRLMFGGLSLSGGERYGVQVTDENGRKHVWRLSMGSGAEQAHTLRLPPPAEAVVGGSIAGTTMDAGSDQPMGGVMVIVTRTTEDDSPVFRREVHTGADGSFRLDDAPAGDYRLEFTGPGMALEVRDITVTDSATTDLGEVHLHGVGHLLFVIESDGSLPPGLGVRIEATVAGDDSATRVRSGLFNETITFENLRRGEVYTVTITSDGHLPETFEITVPEGDATPRTVRLRSN